MEFTKEEINLCKQVADKRRKTIEHGDWFIWGDDVPMVASGNMSPRKGLIPLWTISDCLEFLEFRCPKIAEWSLETNSDKDGKIIKSEYVFWVDFSVNPKRCKPVIGEGKTPLEACLKAVLAVLKEEPNDKVDK